MVRRYGIQILVFLLLVTACAAGNGYPAASQRYDAESVLYSQAGDAIDRAHDEGRVTAAQWTRFQDDQAAVRVVDALVFADLISWRDTGVKPATYETNAQALRAAQQKVRDLAAEVNR